MTPDEPAVVQRPSHDGDAVTSVLFCADGRTRAVPPESLGAEVQERDLLWVDIDTAAGQDMDGRIAPLAAGLGIDQTLLPLLCDFRSAPRLAGTHEQFLAQVFFARNAGELKFEGVPVTVLAAPRVVLTVHAGPIDSFGALLAREDRSSALGALHPAQFLCSLLDWQVASYHEAVSVFEREVERIEERILADRVDERTDAIARLRTAASRLRRMLEAHRPVFAGMARPDFRPHEDRDLERSFQHLYQNFHHAMQDVEGMRETVGGTLALITNQITLRTSRSMRLLTFVTVVVGVVAIVTGALGMNFEMPFYKGDGQGFWITLGALAMVCVALVVWGRRRNWY